MVCGTGRWRDLRVGGTVTTKTRIYSPLQVGFVSWQPVAGVFVLAKNFDALGDKVAATRTMVWGGLFVVWFYGLLFVYQPRGPYIFAIQITFVSLAHQIAARYQMSNFAISYSKVFDFQSDERVASVVIVALIISATLLSAIDLALFGLPSVLD